MSTPASLGRTLSALADPTRRAVIDLLSRDALRAGDLARELELSPAGLSRHLRVLRQSGLVTETIADHDARVRFYELERKPFDELQSWLREVQQFWQEQLSAFKAHAESSRTPRARKRRGQ